MQVFVIHGGTAFATYDEFVTYLKTKEIDIEKMNLRGWKDGLAGALGEGYQVVAPQMPNKQNAKYSEWKLWFERFFGYMQDGVVLVGHSLGALFLAKYLSEGLLPKKIKAVFLVAAPYDIDLGRGIPSFELGSLQKLAQNTLFLYHSTDDTVVPFSELAKYQKALPRATARVFNDRGHFNTETFPELAADIKNL